MGSDKELTNVSKATLERLPSYHRCRAEKREAGEKPVSSPATAEELHLSAVQVRKDLAAISSAAGKPKLGFEVDELLGDINRLLGYNNVTDAVLVGVGGLGSALAGYGGFKSYGLNIVAAFDTDPARIGKEVGGVRVYSADVLSQTVREKKVRIGIIAVPKQAAQAAADALVEGGVRAIWNFAPVHLALPADIAVKNEDMAASLAILSRRLAEILKNEK